MARNVFSVPIFFIVFRETLEAVIIVSVLLGLVEQIVHTDSDHLQGESSASSSEGGDQKEQGVVASQGLPESEDDLLKKRRLIRKMRVQVHYAERAIPSM